MPNITSSVTRGSGYDFTATGAIRNMGESPNGYSTYGTIFKFKNWDFDASRSSSAYKDNAPVRPLSLLTAFLIKY